MAESQTTTRLANDPQMPRPGSVVGRRYEVQGVLGEGGFAVVYAAYDARTKGRVAIKVLDPIMSRRSEFASRFIREVETVSQLRHHNTISIFDAGETDNGCLYLVMELLEGKALDVLLEETGALPADRVKHIAAQILKSLQEAHSRGIIHRDLKPANVFVANMAGERDYVKVLDFGIAKSLDESQDASLTATGQVMCSPHYVAPERVKEHRTLPASDLYSLGVMMIELLEGKPPYEAETPMMLAVKHLSTEPVPLGPNSLAAPYVEVIRRATAKSLDERYDSAIEMLDELMSAEARPAKIGTSTTLTSPQSGATTELDSDAIPAARSRAPLAVAAAVALLLAVVGVAATLRSGAPGEVVETPPAEPEPVAVAAPVEPAPAPPPAPEPPPRDVPGAFRTASALVTAAEGRALARAIVASRQLAATPPAEPEPSEHADDERGTRADAPRADSDRRRSERPARETERSPSPEPPPTPAEPTPVATPEPAPAEAEREDGDGDEGGRGRRIIRTDLAPRQ